MEVNSKAVQGNSSKINMVSMISNQGHQTSIGPVTSQPQRNDFPNDLNDSPGLEYLKNRDRLFVKRKSNCCSYGREFFIKTKLKEDIYVGIEADNWCTLGCSSLEMKISDLRGNEVLQFTRFPECMTSYFEVKTPSGQMIARVKEKLTWCSNEIIVTNHNDETILRLVQKSCNRRAPFKILTMDGDQVGFINRVKYSEDFCDATYAMEINFDTNLNIHMKAALIAASLLLEIKQRRNNAAVVAIV
ncbi:uncharacterized protein LOC116350408 [Contarinia nasturtii]|uniref:uncharacterized protein LOC116350408 n=1 Tax=Contarinia nasturtii TaxID=265458 RepID=UPI0012D459B2|nr:uncharacterized protein LOC116350408 [Contarinia nasturtii]